MALKPSNRYQRNPVQRNRLFHWPFAVVFAIVGLAGGILLCFMLERDSVSTASDEPQSRKITRIKEVTSSTPISTIHTEPKSISENKPQWTNLQGKAVTDYRFAVPPGSYRDEKGILRRPGGMRILEREPAHIINISKGKTERLFSNGAENQILDLLMFNPNRTHLAAGIYGPGFVNSFIKSLDQKIEIFPNDSDDIQEKKRAVIEAKQELKAAMDRGEDICEIMRETSRQLMQLSNYRKDLERELVNVIKQDLDENDTISDDDIATYITAANKLLEERGAEPLKTPKLIMIAERLREKKHE